MTDPDLKTLKSTSFERSPHFDVAEHDGYPNTCIRVALPLLEPALKRLPNTSIIDCAPLSQATIYQYCLKIIREILSKNWDYKILEGCKAAIFENAGNILVRKKGKTELEIGIRYGQRGQVFGDIKATVSLNVTQDSVAYSKELFEAFLTIKEHGFAPGEILFKNIKLSDVEHYNENFNGEPLINCLLIDRGPDKVAIVS